MPPRRRVSFIIFLVVFAAAISSGSSRQWRTAAGQTFEAELVSVDGDNAVFSANGKQYRYPVSELSVPDRLFVNKTAYQMSRGGLTAAPSPAPTATLAATPAPLQLAGQSLQAAGENEIEVPITDAAALNTVRVAYSKPSAKAKMLVVLPSGFDPAQKSWPLLIVSSTTDGQGSSINSAKANYLPDATAKGYAVVAVDGEFGKPAGHGDSTDFRWALVSSALATVNKEWPKSKSWPVVTAGVSGGAGYASHQAMMLLQKQFPVTGLFLAATGWDPTDFADVLHRTPFVPLHNLPVFMSAGDNDQTATKEITDRSHQDVVREGFRKVRFEHFSGGHQLYRQHLQMALDWFLEENAKTKGTGSPNR